MNFFEKFLLSLKATMPEPTNYGWFHLMFIAIAITSITLLCIFALNVKEKTFRWIVFSGWLTIVILEIYKQLVFSINANGDQAVWEFQWYAFPFQLCSSPLYLLPFITFLKDGKVRDSIIAFLATYSMFGGLVVFLYPNDVFVSTIGINIQTMVHHGLQLVFGIYFLVYYRHKLNWLFFVKGIITFATMCAIAMTLNIVMYHCLMAHNGQTFNLFYFSPYYPCTLAVLSDFIWPNVPYVIFLLTYLIGFTLAAAIVYTIPYYIIKGVRKNAK
jgi:hypothetical protein